MKLYVMIACVLLVVGLGTPAWAQSAYPPCGPCEAATVALPSYQTTWEYQQHGLCPPRETIRTDGPGFHQTVTKGLIWKYEDTKVQGPCVDVRRKQLSVLGIPLPACESVKAKAVFVYPVCPVCPPVVHVHPPRCF